MRILLYHGIVRFYVQELNDLEEVVKDVFEALKVMEEYSEVAAFGGGVLIEAMWMVAMWMTH